MTDTETKYWIVVSSVDNFHRTKDLGFTIQGLKSRHRKKAEQMRPGDKIVTYAPQCLPPAPLVSSCASPPCVAAARASAWPAAFSPAACLRLR